MNWTWTIPNIDPYVDYAIYQISNWVALNYVTIIILMGVFLWLQKKAAQMEAVEDDKVVSMLGHILKPIATCGLWIFSFKWLPKKGADK